MVTTVNCIKQITLITKLTESSWWTNTDMCIVIYERSNLVSKSFINFLRTGWLKIDLLTHRKTAMALVISFTKSIALSVKIEAGNNSTSVITLSPNKVNPSFVPQLAIVIFRIITKRYISEKYDLIRNDAFSDLKYLHMDCVGSS